MVLRLVFIAFLLFLVTCGDREFNNPTDPGNVSPPGGIDYKSVTDDRDGKTYRTVKIGSQEWMAENLNYQDQDPSSSISFCIDNEDGEDKYILVNNGGYCNIYGRLYSYDAAKNICPNGWHLPSRAEWEDLLDFATWQNLKSQKGWKTYLQGTDIGTDSYGFTALPGGYNGEDVGSNGYWWSATKSGASNAYYASTIMENITTIGTGNLLSVRCLKGIASPSSSSAFAVSSSSSVGSSSASSNQCGGKTYNQSTQYCSNGTVKEYGSVRDKGGKTYKTVVIGSQEWMAENLNYDIPNSKCYNNLATNCTKYGKLYDWAAAMNFSSGCNSTVCGDESESYEGICPIDWHIPSVNEFLTLMNYVESQKSCSKCAGKYLKARSGWNDNGNGEDAFGFAALPGGLGDSDGDFYDGSYTSDWWTSSERNDEQARLRELGSDNDSIGLYYSAKTDLLSIRCIKGKATATSSSSSSVSSSSTAKSSSSAAAVSSSSFAKSSSSAAAVSSSSLTPSSSSAAAAVSSSSLTPSSSSAASVSSSSLTPSSSSAAASSSSSAAVSSSSLTPSSSSDSPPPPPPPSSACEGEECADNSGVPFRYMKGKKITYIDNLY